MSTTIAAASSKSAAGGPELDRSETPLAELSKIITKLERTYIGHDVHSCRERWKGSVSVEQAHKLLRPYKCEFVRFLARIGCSKPYGFQLVNTVRTWSEVSETLRNQFAFTALVILANSNSPAAIEEAKQVVERGERISVEAAKKLVAKHQAGSGRAKAPAALQVKVLGVATIVLHGVKGGSPPELMRLQAAIQSLVAQFEMKGNMS